MKIKNPITERRERKEAERRRKEAEAKKKNKRTLGICAGVLVALFIIIGIGAATEDKEPVTDAPSIVSSSVLETQEPTESTEPESTPPETTEPEETDAPAETVPTEPVAVPTNAAIDLSSIPAFSGSPYVVVNDNVPSFDESELSTTSFETYSNLDSLGRCGVAYANIGTDLMPPRNEAPLGR